MMQNAIQIARKHLLAGVLVFSLVFTAGTLAGCDDKPAPSANSPTASAAKACVARGVVVALPGPKSTLRIHHETIADWPKPDGTLGMNEMEMPFEPKADVSMTGIAEGDAVEFTVEVTPGAPAPNWKLTKIAKLPAGTEPHFKGK